MEPKINRTTYMGLEIRSSLPPDLMNKAIASIQSTKEFMDWWKLEIENQKKYYASTTQSTGENHTV